MINKDSKEPEIALTEVMINHLELSRKWALLIVFSLTILLLMMFYLFGETIIFSENRTFLIGFTVILSVNSLILTTIIGCLLLYSKRIKSMMLIRNEESFLAVQRQLNTNIKYRKLVAIICCVILVFYVLVLRTGNSL